MGGTKQTVLRFAVAFETEDPFAARKALLEKLRGVPGVEGIEAGEMTVKCPLSRLGVTVGFETFQQAEKLYGKLTRIIQRHPGSSLWSRECTLGEIFE